MERADRVECGAVSGADRARRVLGCGAVSGVDRARCVFGCGVDRPRTQPPLITPSDCLAALEAGEPCGPGETWGEPGGGGELVAAGGGVGDVLSQFHEVDHGALWGMRGPLAAKARDTHSDWFGLIPITFAGSNRGFSQSIPGAIRRPATDCNGLEGEDLRGDLRQSDDRSEGATNVGVEVGNPFGSVPGPNRVCGLNKVRICYE
jgi:hypothetical protein